MRRAIFVLPTVDGDVPVREVGRWGPWIVHRSANRTKFEQGEGPYNVSLETGELLVGQVTLSVARSVATKAQRICPAPDFDIEAVKADLKAVREWAYMASRGER